MQVQHRTMITKCIYHDKTNTLAKPIIFKLCRKKYGKLALPVLQVIIIMFKPSQIVNISNDIFRTGSATFVRSFNSEYNQRTEYLKAYYSVIIYLSFEFRCGIKIDVIML